MRISDQPPSHAEVQALKQIDLGKVHAPADHARDDHDAQRLGRLRQRTDQLRREQSQGPEAKRPIQSSRLAMEIGMQMGHQRQYDHSVSLDQIGPTDFTQRRAAQLASIPGGQVIAAQYGQTFAADMADFAPFYPRLKIGNDAHVDYHREVPSPSLQKSLEQLYTKTRAAKKLGGLPKDHDVVFVNSSHAVHNLQLFLSSFGTEASTGEKPQPEALARGVFAVPVPKRYRESVGEMIVLLGAIPSAYQAKRVLCGNLPTIPSANVDNRQHIAPLMHNRPDAPSHRLRLASPTEGTGAMAHAAADLMDDLCTVLVQSRKIEQHVRNPMLMYGLTGLREHAEKLNSLHNDTTHFSNTYRAMMEELHVILTATRPYTEDHFKSAALHKLASRLDPTVTAPLKKPEVYMTTSGMNAIMQGLDAAAQFSGDNSFTVLFTKRHGTSPTYYEAERLMELKGLESSTGSRTLVAVLNNSYPEANGRTQDPWDVNAVVEATRAKIGQHKPDGRPFTLVLDTTVEHRGDLHHLTSAFKDELAQGKLQIALCKSYQKHANLCSSKVMAGSFTLLGVDSPKRQEVDSELRKIELSNDWMNNDEGQLMTHFVRSGQHEFSLFDRSVANANFVRDTCFTGEGEHAPFDGHHRHLPFGMISMHSGSGDYFNFPELHMRNAAGSDTSHGFAPDDNLDSHMIRMRDSFGFGETVQAYMPDLDGYDSSAVRLSFGQESKAELTEMFYMPSRLLLEDGSIASPLEARSLVNELVNAALTPKQRSDTADKSLAHKLALVGTNEASSLDDRQRLSGSVAGMRRTLERPDSHQAFTLNKIASVVGHLGNMTLNQKLIDRLAGGADRKVVDQLLQGLISSNMPGVSRIGRETVARFHAALCSFDMKSKDPEQRRKGVQNLVDGLARMNVASMRGAYVDLVSDAVLAEQPLELRERLLDVVFRPLSPTARVALIDKHLNSKQLNFAEACIDSMERQGPGRTPGLSDALQKRRATLIQAKVQGQV